MEDLERFVGLFEDCYQIETLQSCLEEICEQLEYESCFLLNIDDSGDSPVLGRQVGVSSTALSKWVQTNVDHILFSIRSMPSPIVLRNSDRSRRLPNAFMLPLGPISLNKHVLMVQVGDTLPLEIVEKIAWFWMILGNYAFKALCRCSEEPGKQFTPREVECLRWVARGKTSWEVSKILGISERTINFHIQNCMKKTNSVNRQQVISKCLLGGII